MIRNIALAEQRALARALDDELKDHRRACYHCRPRQPCAEAREMAAELASVRDEIKHWFDPGPDQGMLL